MKAPDAAWEIIAEHLQPLGAVEVPLDKALGCCLAEDVRADRDLPPADRSSMDGYAVRSADLERQPCVLQLAGEVAAGSRRRPRVTAGACVRVFTGASLPPGADAVVMVEDTREHDGAVTILPSATRGPHVLKRGEDASRGIVLLSPGTRIGAPEAGICAAVGKARVRVHRRPGVEIICTGSELRPVEGRLKSHQIRDSNGPALSAALAEWGMPGVRFRRVRDRPETLLAALLRALKRAGVVLLTGGVSVGARDFVPQAVERAGGVVRLHGVAMKPGKPVLYATAPRGRHIFGLPGNPLSALTALHEFALPALRRLAGRPLDRCREAWPLPLYDDAESLEDRTRCQLARLVSDPAGLAAAPVASNSSADLVSSAEVDGVILLPPPRRRFEAGSLVAFRLWRPLW